MVEPIMFVAIGFLIAGLLVIGVIPLVHARAERLTMRRMEAMTPLSMVEIQAEKDQLRAEFAMSTRRLEMAVEQLKAKTTNQLTEIGKKSDAIGRLKLELGEKTAALFALEAKGKQLTDELLDLRDDHESSSSTLAETERALANARAELAQVTSELNRGAVDSTGQRVELLALRAQSEALKGQIESYELKTRELQERLRSKSEEAQSLSDTLAKERARADEMSGRCAELNRQLMEQTTESEILGRRVEQLRAQLDQQERFLADREFNADRPRNEASSAQELGSEARSTPAEALDRAAIDAIRAEKDAMSAQLRQAQIERSRLEREIAALQENTQAGSGNERAENALLRERINDVAAEVARLTAALEGSGSPIAAILNGDADHVAGASNGSNGAPSAAPSHAPQTKGTLADRIRALQSRTSHVEQASSA
jgi:chromosome segregation ATPase